MDGIEFDRDGVAWRVTGEAAALLRGALDADLEDPSPGVLGALWDDVVEAIAAPQSSVLTDAMAAMCIALRDGEISATPPLGVEEARKLRRQAATCLRLWEGAESDVSPDMAQAVRASSVVVDICMRAESRQEFGASLAEVDALAPRDKVAEVLRVLASWCAGSGPGPLDGAAYWQKQLTRLAWPRVETWMYSRGNKAAATRLRRAADALEVVADGPDR